MYISKYASNKYIYIDIYVKEKYHFRCFCLYVSFKTLEIFHKEQLVAMDPLTSKWKQK